MSTINGAIITDFNGYAIGNFVMPLANGKIVTLGFSPDGLGVERFNSNGSLDSSFGTDGKLTFAPPIKNVNAAIALSNGGFAIAGDNGSQFAIAKYSTNWMLDTGFDTDGVVIVDTGAWSEYASLLTEYMGKLLVSGFGSWHYSGINMIRLNSNGSLDSSFAGDGVLNTSDSNIRGTASAMTIQPDKKIVVVTASGDDFRMARYNYLGQQDMATETDLGGTDNAFAVELQGMKIMVGGTSNGDFAFARYNLDGSLDTSFDTDGKKVLIGSGVDFTLSKMITTPNGQFIAVGTTDEQDIALYRFTSSGDIDNNFGTDGKVVTDLGGWEVGNNVAVQADGKILVVGGTDSSEVLLRYNTDGSLDTTFSGSNVVNHLPVGKVTIAGDAIKGHVLTASNNLTDADGLGTITYQWQAGGVNVGTTSNKYIPTVSDIGKTITATAKYNDLLGTAESVTSTATAVIADSTNAPPSGTVTISGSAIKGQTLTASNNLTDADGLGTITYQWQADGVNVGTTANKYIPTVSDIGKTITVTANYIDGLNKAESVISSATSLVINPPKVGVTIAHDSTSPTNTSEGNTLGLVADKGTPDSVRYLVSLNAAPAYGEAGYQVSLKFASNDKTEASVSPATLVFTSSNWNVPQTLTITGVDDLLNDGNVAYVVTAQIDTLKTTALEYKTIMLDNLNLTNVDDGFDKPVKIYGTDDVAVDRVDYLKGNNGNDALYGKDGFDELRGNLGNDTLYGENGEDVLYGGDGDDALYGASDNDILYGENGNDTLDGGIGADFMIGGIGNDTYYVDDSGDIINDLGAKTDVDKVIITQTISYTLSSTVENASLDTSAGNSSLIGNALNNVLVGNLNANTLNGGIGNDTLTGGAGKDNFVFNSTLSANVDKITDFNPVNDTIKLENGIFSKLITNGVLNAAYFRIGTTADSNDYLIYNKATGAVLYDDDGNGAHSPIQIATLGINLALTNADFVVI